MKIKYPKVYLRHNNMEDKRAFLIEVETCSPDALKKLVDILYSEPYEKLDNSNYFFIDISTCKVILNDGLINDFLEKYYLFNMTLREYIEENNLEGENSC